MSNCVVLFSGGTDSLCSAALAAEKHDHVHLLTFYERATKASPWPVENLGRLRKKYGASRFSLHVFSTDKVVRHISYLNYFSNLRMFHFLNLATPGISSLSWHLRAIQFCRDHRITFAYDGMTKELLHLPGHMPEIRDLFTNLYREFGISFSSMVLDWDVPEDQRFVDRLIVDRHGFTIMPQRKRRTTGEWLYENEILPHKNVKGSEFDRMMQHDCYPFILYNMLVFWIYEPLIGFEAFKQKLREFMASKILVGRAALLESAPFLLSENEFHENA